MLVARFRNPDTLEPILNGQLGPVPNAAYLPRPVESDAQVRAQVGVGRGD